jgi:hypothetical protein
MQDESGGMQNAKCKMPKRKPAAGGGQFCILHFALA